MDAIEKGNYGDAIKYFEEALIRGEVQAVDSLMTIYDNVLDLCAYQENESEYWKYRLEQATKMQQYGKIVEDEIRSGRVF